MQQLFSAKKAFLLKFKFEQIKS